MRQVCANFQSFSCNITSFIKLFLNKIIENLEFSKTKSNGLHFNVVNISSKKLKFPEILGNAERDVFVEFQKNIQIIKNFANLFLAPKFRKIMIL